MVGVPNQLVRFEQPDQRIFVDRIVFNIDLISGERSLSMSVLKLQISADAHQRAQHTEYTGTSRRSGQYWSYPVDNGYAPVRRMGLWARDV